MYLISPAIPAIMSVWKIQHGFKLNRTITSLGTRSSYRRNVRRRVSQGFGAPDGKGCPWKPTWSLNWTPLTIFKDVNAMGRKYGWQRPCGWFASKTPPCQKSDFRASTQSYQSLKMWIALLSIEALDIYLRGNRRWSPKIISKTTEIWLQALYNLSLTVVDEAVQNSISR